VGGRPCYPDRRLAIARNSVVRKSKPRDTGSIVRQPSEPLATRRKALRKGTSDLDTPTAPEPTNLRSLRLFRDPLHCLHRTHRTRYHRTLWLDPPSSDTASYLLSAKSDPFAAS